MNMNNVVIIMIKSNIEIDRSKKTKNVLLRGILTEYSINCDDSMHANLEFVLECRRNCL